MPARRPAGHDDIDQRSTASSPTCRVRRRASCGVIRTFRWLRRRVGHSAALVDEQRRILGGALAARRDLAANCFTLRARSSPKKASCRRSGLGNKASRMRYDWTRRGNLLPSAARAPAVPDIGRFMLQIAVRRRRLLPDISEPGAEPSDHDGFFYALSETVTIKRFFPLRLAAVVWAALAVWLAALRRRRTPTRSPCSALRCKRTTPVGASTRVSTSI